MTHVTDWMTALSTKEYDAETRQFYRACGIDGVELSIKADLCDQIDWAAFRKNADEAGIKILSYHLPFSKKTNIASPDEEIRKGAVAIQSALIEKAAGIGISRFVIHASMGPITDEERPQWMASAKKSLQELAEFAARFQAVICVEDLPRHGLGHNTREMLDLLEADERLRVCFDVNHLCLKNGSSHQEFIAALGNKIVTTHISDYDFVDEKHFFPGYGLIDWKALVEGLEQADYSGPFLYEGGFGPSPWAPEVPFGKIEDARNRQLTIKELRGNQPG